MSRFALLLAFGLVGSLCIAPVSEAAQIQEGLPDWEALADLDTVQVVSENENGSRRDTTVWLVVVDGQGYVRTGGSAWGDNVLRKPEVQLRVDPDRWDLGVQFVEDEELRQQVTDAFREKYGFTDALISLFRGSNPLIMRLTGR